MGRYLLLMIGGLMMAFSTTAIVLDQSRVDRAEANARAFAVAKARNMSTSGAYMAASNMSLNSNWDEGFANLALGGASGRVWIEDQSSNPSLSAFEKMIVSVGLFDDVAETTMVTLRLPPDIGKYALFATGDVDNINTYNEFGFEDSTLIMKNAGILPAIDWDALEMLAINQGSVEGNGKGKSFYFKDKEPNVTIVYGDLIISGNTTLYGIYIVHGNVIMNGNVHVEGIIAMPDPGSVIMHGGGNPKIMNVTGGVVVDANVKGTGNHVSVKYHPDYMKIFADYQKDSGMMITRWLESPVF